MACNPPYCMGTGSSCGCNCRCCPPCPCYTSWTYLYLCGSSSSTFPAGCDCTYQSPSPSFRTPSLDVEFPDFEYPSYIFNNENTNEGYVFAQSSSIPCMDVTSCSIPCSTIPIVLTTSGCCLFPAYPGSQYSFYAVGAGTVSLSGCGSACDGDFECSLNGGGTSISVTDCQLVNVTITQPPEACCCSCCLVSSSGSLLGACSGSTSFAAFKQRSVTKGKQKTYISKKKLLERIAKARR